LLTTSASHGLTRPFLRIEVWEDRGIRWRSREEREHLSALTRAKSRVGGCEEFMFEFSVQSNTSSSRAEYAANEAISPTKDSVFTVLATGRTVAACNVVFGKGVLVLVKGEVTIISAFFLLPFKVRFRR
jgi:hypothetical protein